MFWAGGARRRHGVQHRESSNEGYPTGAPSYRPSFNAYMWADAHALARIADLAGDAAQAASYRKRADALKAQIQGRLWDPKREFFFPMFRDDETDKDGNVVKKNTLVHETGKFAGSPHGREVASYVPWCFNLPDSGYEAAWKFLMDPDYFYAKFGPTTTERNDPLFLLSKSCCWWSGQSWPFATTQTLKAMANLLHNYEQSHVSREDYFKLLKIYSRSQRKDEKPYIAEALHPDTGSWDGHDYYYRSEHYFHSGYVDLVITGLVGLKVEESDTLTIDPLVPSTWDYFALDQIPYRGCRLAVFWDRDGTRYGRGAGLQIWVDGQRVSSSPAVRKLEAKLPAAKEIPLDARESINYAVNNDGDYFPRFEASHIGPRSSLAFLHDGNRAWYHLRPPLRWTSAGSGQPKDSVAVNFGVPRKIDDVKLYLLDDGAGESVAAPASFELEYRASAGDDWAAVPGQVRTPKEPRGHRPNTVRFPALVARELRVVLTHKKGRASGMTELEAWGRAEGPHVKAPPPAGNLAFNPKRTEGFPKATASFSDRYGGVPENANDGKIVYRASPVNRWTSYGSPNKTSDWLQLDFGKRQTVGRVLLHIYDDRGGGQAPKSYVVQVPTENGGWTEISGQTKNPVQPKGSAVNTVNFPPVRTSKIRVVFTHNGKGNTRSGVTELEVWEK